MNYFTLVQQIKKREIASLYLLYGSEEFLIGDILKKIKKELVGEELQAFNYLSLDEDKNTLRELEEAVSTLPFLEEKKLVIFRVSKLLTGDKKEEEQLLIKIIEDLPDFTHLVVVSGTVDKRRKIYQSFLKLGQIIELASLKPWELEKWILERVAQLGKSLDRQGAAYLLEVLGKDLYLLFNELEKVALYVGEREKITKEDLERILSRQGEQNIFRFLDALGNRKTEESINFLQQLLKLGEPPVKILYMINQQFRLLWQVKALVEKGYAKSEITAKLRPTSSYAIEKSLTKTNNFSWQQLENILSLLLEADKKTKTGRESPCLVLEMLAISICQD